MTAPGCLSDACTRTTICDLCQKAADDYWTRGRRQAIETSVRFLESLGYKVTPPEQTVTKSGPAQP